MNESKNFISSTIERDSVLIVLFSETNVYYRDFN